MDICGFFSSFHSLNPQVDSPQFAVTVAAAALSTAIPGRSSLPPIGFKWITSIYI